MRLILVVILSLCVGLSAIGEALDQPSEAEVRARTEAISKSLRCVVCQSESIHDSNAPLAADMRRQVEAMVRDGKSDREIREFFHERYGDYVLMRPPVQGNTWLLWFSPLILVLIGVGWLWWRARRAPAARPAADNVMNEADRARVQAALASQDKQEAEK